MRAIRTGLNAAGMPVENSKGEASAGQEEINVRYAERAGLGRHPRDRQERGQGDRLVQGQGGHLHGEVRPARRGLVEPPAPVAADARRQARLLRRRRAARDVEADARAGWRGCSTTPRATTYFLAPYVNSYKRFVGRDLRADQDGLVDRQPHRRLPAGRRGHARRSASNAGSAAPTSTPTSPMPRRSPPASTASSASLELEPEFRGDAYVTGALPRDPEDAARRGRGAAAARRCCARPSATRWSSTISTPRAGSRPSATAA